MWALAKGLRGLLACVLLIVAACDAGPSAVSSDGAGVARADDEASMAVIDGGAKAPAVVSGAQYGDWPLWSQNRKYSAVENAHYHFDKHAAEFGVTSYEAWVANVHGFVHNPPPGTEKLKRPNGDVLLYDAKGNVFAVMTKQGAPRTMFKPDDGAAYWRKQKEIEAKRRVGRDPD